MAILNSFVNCPSATIGQGALSHRTIAEAISCPTENSSNPVAIVVIFFRGEIDEDLYAEAADLVMAFMGAVRAFAIAGTKFGLPDYELLSLTTTASWALADFLDKHADPSKTSNETAEAHRLLAAQATALRRYSTPSTPSRRDRRSEAKNSPPIWPASGDSFYPRFA